MLTQRFLKFLEISAKRSIYAVLRLVFRNREMTLPVDASRMKKVLIFRYDRIGDMIVTTPLVNLLRERLPQAELHILASPRNIALIENDARFHKIFLYNGVNAGLRDLWSLLRLTRTLRRERYDCVLPLVFHGQATWTGILLNLVAASHAVKPMHLEEGRKELYATLYNMHLPKPDPTPENSPPMAEVLVRFACAIFGWDYSPALVRYGIALSPDHEASAEALCKELSLDRSTTMVNLSAGKDFCQWSEDRNREFLRQFRAAFPEVRVLLNAAPSERAQAERLVQSLAAEFASASSVSASSASASSVNGALRNDLVLLPPTNDILAIAAVIKRVGMVVTPDTSVVHLATAFEIPLVVFYSRLSFGGDWLPFPVMPYRALFTEGFVPAETITPEAVLAAYADLRTSLQAAPQLA
jgi:ADP-heptose:LPS heptosyltransferase